MTNKTESYDEASVYKTMTELELKGSLFSRASGHEKQTAR